MEYIDFRWKYGCLWEIWIFDEEKWITILKLSHREFIFFPDPARRETVDSLNDIPVGLFYHYKKCESSIFRRKKSWPFEKVKKLCVFGHSIVWSKSAALLDIFDV